MAQQRDSGEINNVKALGRDTVQTDLNLEDPEKYNQERERRGSSHFNKGPSGFNKLTTNRARVTSEDSDSLIGGVGRNN